MKKRVLAVVFAAFMALSLTACGGNASTSSDTPDTTGEAVANEPATPPDLTGTWVQVNSSSEDSYQEATITEDTITINWVSPDSKALYWAGTFEAPTTADEPYTWDSVNDTEQTATALLASGDETKTFTYQDGQISYDATALGVTTTVRLEKQ